MSHFACPGCGAEFEITADLPPSFTCGACGADVVRPASGGRPKTAPAHAGAPAARPRTARDYYSRAEPAAGGRTKLIIWGSVGLVLVIGLVVFLLRPERTPDASPDTAGHPVVQTPPRPAPATLPTDTPTKAPTAAPAPADDDTGSAELVRLKTRMKLATSAKDWFDVAQFGRQQLDAVRGAASSPEIPEFEKRIASCLERAISIDPDFEPARLDLGHVRYSKTETAQWAKSPLTPSKLASALEEAMDAIDPELVAEKTRRALPATPDAIWLSGDLAARTASALNEARGLHENREASNVAWFYTRAKKAALNIEGSLGDYFKDPGQEDAFDAMTFRPYVVMVQKDPTEKSVDRAYEIIQMLRTLENTWKRRYGKEIDFSGSMAAPPVIFLRSRKDYEKYQQRYDPVTVLSAGHYEPATRRIVIYKSTEEEERNVIFHEGTHMLFDHKNSVKDPETQAKESMWFSEGIAEYFGGHGKTKDRDPVTQAVIYEPGRLNDTRLGTLTLARAMKRLIKFQDLIQITRAQWNRKNERELLWAELTYAQGWALVYYLNHGDNGKYAKDFIEYMKGELNGKSGLEAFQAVFGKYGMDEVEKGYLAFLDLVLKKHQQKKIVDGKMID